MRLRRLICLLYCLAFSGNALFAQTARPKVVVIAPVYLDSAFNGDNYLLGKNNLPRYVLPGLDFYNGMMLAVDSLNKEKTSVDIVFVDSKSATDLMLDPEGNADLQHAACIIASFNNKNEIKPLADFALEKKIPLLSATYPNDGGITGNPYFTLINPTLTAHIEAVYRFLRRTYPVENILYFRRAGAGEDLIQNIISKQQAKTGGIPLKLKTIALPDSFTTEQVVSYLDSNRRNIVVCGSLDDRFAVALSNSIGNNKSYKTIVIGMPVWDGIRDLNKNIEYVYTSPYNLTRTDKVSLQLADKYKTRFAGRPSDMVFKSFELVYRSAKLLQKYGKDWLIHLNSPENKIFHDFDLEAVKSANGTDYLENKKLYFIRKADGRIKSVN